MGEMDIRYAPLFLHIREISLSNFYSRIIINANRTINLQEVFSNPTLTAQAATPSDQAPQTTVAAAESRQEPPQRWKVAIDKITLQGGTINFTDDSIKPRFSANLLEIGGRISGLSSDENKFGEVELRGKYDRYAPLEITGKINPLRNDLYVELKANFKDMDLTAVSPYSGRYAGYTIQKGKLSFQLEYLIVKNKLDAKNNFFLDQFDFGDPIDSPDATKLPVKLAVALLKDQNGEIKLDIPVSGELNDPKFSVGRVVLKIIVNLLVKVATSPFALLGAIFGGGEQLGYAEFDYGSAALTAETQKKLDIIMKALHDRPGLKMDIIGHVDLEKDREGLKQELLLRRVKAQKIKDMVRKGGETPSLDDVIVTPQEYPVYLKQAYKAENFPKPRNIVGMAKDLPVPEMEKLMLTNLKVTDDDLKALSQERARAVRNYLLQSQQITEERIFIVESNTLDVKKDKEGAKNSRTDFKLK
jgi:flagellar motor protein MotB